MHALSGYWTLDCWMLVFLCPHNSLKTKGSVLDDMPQDYYNHLHYRTQMDTTPS